MPLACFSRLRARRPPPVSVPSSGSDSRSGGLVSGSTTGTVSDKIFFHVDCGDPHVCFSIVITTWEIVHVINFVHVTTFFELRTSHVALRICIIILDVVSFKLLVYKIYYVSNNMVCVQNLLRVQ